MSGLGEALRSAWAAVKTKLGQAAPGSPIQPCPLAGGLPDGKPVDCCAAPKTITLPKVLNDAMKDGFTNSFPGGVSQEQGGTIVKAADGTVKVINQHSGTGGTFSPDRTTGTGETVIGIFHTHPYDQSEGGHQGVSFSGADLSIAANEGEPDYVDAGSHQFAIVPTGETPSVDHVAFQTEWDQTFREARKTKGFEEASRATALELAKKYKMAYYEGKDGVLEKLSC